MNVGELKQWLEKFPEDTVVQVVCATDDPILPIRESEFEGSEWDSDYFDRGYSGRYLILGDS